MSVFFMGKNRKHSLVKDRKCINFTPSSLCELTEACVLIMSGWALFLPCFVYICAWCQLRSLVPFPNSMAGSTADDTEQRSHQLPFMLPSVTLWGSDVRHAKCQQHSATRCTSSHFADLKSVASVHVKDENTHISSSALLLKCCVFITLQLFTCLILLKRM